MKGRRGAFGRAAPERLQDGRSSPSNKAAVQGVVPAKQQVGFEVPGQAFRGTDGHNEASRMPVAGCPPIGSQAELLVSPVLGHAT